MTGVVYLAGSPAEIHGIGAAFDEKSEDVTSVAPDSWFVVTTCDSDSKCFTHI